MLDALGIVVVAVCFLILVWDGVRAWQNWHYRSRDERIIARLQRLMDQRERDS